MTTQLDTYTDLIHHAGIRKLVQLTLAAAPSCFWFMPAATSGKYHPASSLGTGGLIRHTIAVLRIAQHLLHMENIAPQHPWHDTVLAACLLHDCCKKNDSEQYTAFEHPTRAAELIKATAQPLIDSGDISPHHVRTIAACVACHMGRWNSNPHHPAITLPTPATQLQRLVHTADYLASRKDIALL
jgi:hypothetical protein